MKFLLLLLLCITSILLLVSCAGLPEGRDSINRETERINFSGLQLGICHAGYSATDEEYAVIKELGIKWIRLDLKWSNVEKVRGEWDFSYYDEFIDKANEHGIKVLAILDYDTEWLHEGRDKSRRISLEELPLFLRYIKKVTERYGARVGAFEIWNEPNSPRFWTGSDKDFFELTNQTLDLIKEISPQTLVAVGSMFYHPILGSRCYLKKLIKSGVLEKADAVSLHPYTASKKAMERRILDARKVILNAGYNTPIWITEVGFPTGGMYPFRVKLEEQPSAIAESITRLSSTGVEMIIWYCMYDSKNPEDVIRGMSSENFFGILWPDYTWKPGATAYSIIANELQNSIYSDEALNLQGKNISNLYQSVFKKADGSVSAILWARYSDVELYLAPGLTPISIYNLITGEIYEISKETSYVVTKEPILIHINKFENSSFSSKNDN